MTRRKLMILICLLLIVAGFNTVLLPGVSRAEIGFRGKYLNVFDLSPGESATVSFKLVSLGEQPDTARAYLKDFIKSPRSYQYLEVNSIERSNADWVRFSPDRLTLAPGESGEIAVEINVPNDPSLEGSYWSVLMLEPSHIEPGEGSLGMGFRQIVRYGAQLIVNIKKSGESELNFDDLRVDPRVTDKHGNVRTRMTGVVSNSGSRASLATAKLEIYTDDGTEVGTFRGDTEMVLPGSASEYTLGIPVLEPGSYQALLIMESSGRDETSVGTRFNFKISEEDVGNGDERNASGTAEEPSGGSMGITSRVGN